MSAPPAASGGTQATSLSLERQAQDQKWKAQLGDLLDKFDFVVESDVRFSSRKASHIVGRLLVGQLDECEIWAELKLEEGSYVTVDEDGKELKGKKRKQHYLDHEDIGTKTSGVSFSSFKCRLVYKDGSDDKLKPFSESTWKANYNKDNVNIRFQPPCWSGVPIKDFRQLLPLFVILMWRWKVNSNVWIFTVGDADKITSMIESMVTPGDGEPRKKKAKKNTEKDDTESITQEIMDKVRELSLAPATFRSKYNLVDLKTSFERALAADEDPDNNFIFRTLVDLRYLHVPLVDPYDMVYDPGRPEEDILLDEWLEFLLEHEIPIFQEEFNLYSRVLGSLKLIGIEVIGGLKALFLAKIESVRTEKRIPFSLFKIVDEEAASKFVVLSLMPKNDPGATSNSASNAVEEYAQLLLDIHKNLKERSVADLKTVLARSRHIGHGGFLEDAVMKDILSTNTIETMRSNTHFLLHELNDRLGIADKDDDAPAVKQREWKVRPFAGVEPWGGELEMYFPHNPYAIIRASKDPEYDWRADIPERSWYADASINLFQKQEIIDAEEDTFRT